MLDYRWCAAALSSSSYPRSLPPPRPATLPFTEETKKKNMPRTTTLECPGCPSLRALTFDILGLIKVIEAKGEQKEAAKVVERWGEPDASRCVLATSILDLQFDPLLGVARRNGLIEVLNPVNGDVRASISNQNQSDKVSDDNPVIGLHLFRKESLDSSSSRYCLRPASGSISSWLAH